MKSNEQLAISNQQQRLTFSNRPSAVEIQESHTEELSSRVARDLLFARVAAPLLFGRKSDLSLRDNNLLTLSAFGYWRAIYAPIGARETFLGYSGVRYVRLMRSCQPSISTSTSTHSSPIISEAVEK